MAKILKLRAGDFLADPILHSVDLGSRDFILLKFSHCYNRRPKSIPRSTSTPFCVMDSLLGELARRD